MQDLGIEGAFPKAINNTGQIVGLASSSTGLALESRAFLYSGGQMLDLNMLVPANSGWVLLSASSINDAGQIVGTGLYEGQNRACRRTYFFGRVGVACRTWA